MGWIELLRLFAENQNKASAEANQEAILKFVQIWRNTELLQYGIIAFISIVLLLIYNSQGKKIKKLENSLKSFLKNDR